MGDGLFGDHGTCFNQSFATFTDCIACVTVFLAARVFRVDDLRAVVGVVGRVDLDFFRLAADQCLANRAVDHFVVAALILAGRSNFVFACCFTRGMGNGIFGDYGTRFEHCFAAGTDRISGVTVFLAGGRVCVDDLRAVVGVVGRIDCDRFGLRRTADCAREGRFTLLFAGRSLGLFAVVPNMRSGLCLFTIVTLA